MTSPESSTIGVLVVDDDPLVRVGVKMMLGGAADIRVLGEAADGTEALELVADCAPDVVLMDIRMPVMDGLSATERLRARKAAPEVIVLTTFEADEYVLRALRAGAAGFVLKDTPPEEIVTAIRQVSQGNPALSSAVVRRLIGRIVEPGATSANARQQNASAKLEQLNHREHEVAIAIGEGKPNAEIAAQLCLSVPTVKSHVSSIFTKLRLNNRVQIALLAHDAGLLDEDTGS
ncbi:response regulator transcription factor [Prauserella cavernicola]|uniref:Response regulator transcription factor n=1 Tax=Prauserella cavernicola TaxID=2800127 RepID=A0A934QYX2_9PSEU|nr:response regulator transcription factor [Prauserella cavernicola]MBK1787844.1 response regulator transcription factor [Prauserella cavernicola]